MKFIQQAYKGNNEWVAYLVTLMLLFFGWQIVGIIPLSLVAYIYAGDMETLILAANTNFADLGLDANLYQILIIATFFFGFLSLFLDTNFMH